LLRRYYQYLWSNAENDNKNNIYRLLESHSGAVLLDCGCDTGEFTVEIARRVGTNVVYGIDVVPKRYEQAMARSIRVIEADLNNPFPFEDNSVDVVHSNQVIEHILNLNSFISEIHRVLKPGGYAIVSTENLSSWHNIFALLFGFQPFSLTNIAFGKTIGNPLTLHASDERFSGLSKYETYHHVRVLSYAGLRDLFPLYGLTVENILGAGYYPLPALTSRILAKLDPRHCAFLTVKIRKIKKGDIPQK